MEKGVRELGRSFLLETRDQRPDNISGQVFEWRARFLKETGDRITLIGTNFKAKKSAVEKSKVRHLKTRTNHVIWLLVSGLSHKYARYGNRLWVMLSGLRSLVSSLPLRSIWKQALGYVIWSLVSGLSNCLSQKSQNSLFP